MNKSALLPFPRVLHQFAGIAGRVPDVGDQKITMVYHISVRPDDGQLPRHTFHPRWAEGAVKSLRRFLRPFRRVVRPQIGQDYIRMPFLCLPHGLSCQTVKTSVTPHHKLCYAIVGDMALHLGSQCGKQAVFCVPVSDEKARTNFSHINSPILSIVTYSEYIIRLNQLNIKTMAKYNIRNSKVWVIL